MAAAPIWSARISDELLVYGLCNGEREAFETLFERFFDRIYEMVGRSLQDRAETERMVSRIFIEAFSKIGSYRGESPLPAWFFGFARRALSEYHANRASQWAPDEPCWPSV
jgi:RNA polymerase sigma-70 factor (ECF subfamily)